MYTAPAPHLTSSSTTGLTWADLGLLWIPLTVLILQTKEIIEEELFLKAQY